MSTLQATEIKVIQLGLANKVAQLNKAEERTKLAEAALAKRRQTRDEKRAALVAAGLTKSDVARLLGISIPAVVNSILRANERSTNGTS